MLTLTIVEELWMQPCGYTQAGNNKGHKYTTDDDCLRDIHEYMSMVELLPGASVDHIIAGGRSRDQQVAEVL